MNFASFERAQAAAFAYREGRHTGSLDCLRAVCFILRNRKKSGWGGGSWLSVMEAAGEVAAHEPEPATGNWQLATDRLLQMIVRDVDDIYLEQEPWEDRVAQVVCGTTVQTMAGSTGRAGAFGINQWNPVLYYSFVDRPPRPWFVENIIQKAQEHPQVGQVGGKMMLYR
jgi:hypothetical protein